MNQHTAKEVRTLRDATGAPMHACALALKLTFWNFDEAEKLVHTIGTNYATNLILNKVFDRIEALEDKVEDLEDERAALEDRLIEALDRIDMLEGP